MAKYNNFNFVQIIIVYDSSQWALYYIHTLIHSIEGAFMIDRILIFCLLTNSF